ncbi:restriction endonuclease subunit S [Enterobacter soli]|uniref:restriction endonuclease subunit S n=1 Tax=Enterobacter soli TaxID=885040 RepID=UPI00214993DA|nr:restriction endonuclease subunit S [Enterobacter soli]MCR1318352.1 restriction endonuclease subunit S [Enterobacter soli]
MENLALMPKYEAYKDSQVQWIGDIPVNWNLEKAKWLFYKADRKPLVDDDIVTCFRDGQVTLRKNRRTEGFTNALKEHGYQRICKGDLVIHAMDAFAGAIGVSDSDGKSTPVYAACVPRKKGEVNSYYYAYYMRDLALSGFIVSLAKGIRERSTDFRFNDFAELLLPFPDYEEQTRIANFLDQKTAQIDEAIAIKEQQISLLKERKQIIIQQAVTQGLDPNVPMKDSGVDWIGKIPAHWECTAVKRLLDIPITDGPHTTPQLHDEGIPFISAEAIKGGEINFDKKRGYINEKDYLLFSNKYTPKVNDIYMVKSGATTGRVAIVRTETKFTIWSPLAVFRVDKNKLNPLYLYYFLQSYSFLKGVELSWSFGTQQNIGMGVLGNLFALAPPLEEQQFIVSSIEPHFREIDIASEQVYQQIEKLKEYKTTLINSAVTGKIKITPEMVEQ